MESIELDLGELKGIDAVSKKVINEFELAHTEIEDFDNLVKWVDQRGIYLRYMGRQPTGELKFRVIASISNVVTDITLEIGILLQTNSIMTDEKYYRNTNSDDDLLFKMDSEKDIQHIDVGEVMNRIVRDLSTIFEIENIRYEGDSKNAGIVPAR